MKKKQETQKIKAYRVVDGDVSNAQALLIDNEREFDKIRKEKGIKPSILSEKEYEALKKEVADNKTLSDENEALKKELAKIKKQGGAKVDETKQIEK